MVFEQWVNRIAAALEPEAADNRAPDIQRVSAVLLAEIARSDHDIDASEQRSIVEALSQSCELPADELEELVSNALTDTDFTLSLHEHVKIVNENFSKSDKLQLVEQMWRVAYADGNLDRYEEYTIRKLCDLLYIKHRDFMQAKLKVDPHN